MNSLKQFINLWLSFSHSTLYAILFCCTYEAHCTVSEQLTLPVHRPSTHHSKPNFEFYFCYRSLSFSITHTLSLKHIHTLSLSISISLSIYIYIIIKRAGLLQQYVVAEMMAVDRAKLS